MAFPLDWGVSQRPLERQVWPGSQHMDAGAEGLHGWAEGEREPDGE